MNKKFIDDNKIVTKVSVIGMIANIILVFCKLIIGVMSKSQGLIADGIHSIEDMLNSVMSYIGAKISARPRDKAHPYGYGKVEYIISELIGLTMIIASFVIIDGSIKSIISCQQLDFSIWLVIVCIITIIIKLILFIYTNKKNKQIDNILIKAASIDHRNDIFMTTGTLIGICAGYHGFYFIDGVMGCIIAMFIAYSGFKLFVSSCKVLIDTNLNNNQLEEIIEVVEGQDNVINVDSITSKPIGSRYILLIKISMNENHSVKDSHEIAGCIKAIILNEFPCIFDVIIHINPNTV